jgi:hypothetical protein
MKNRNTSVSNSDANCNNNNEELNGILSLIGENGELILKNKKIGVVPRVFYY